MGVSPNNDDNGFVAFHSGLGEMILCSLFTVVFGIVDFSGLTMVAPVIVDAVVGAHTSTPEANSEQTKSSCTVLFAPLDKPSTINSSSRNCELIANAAVPVRGGIAGC